MYNDCTSTSLNVTTRHRTSNNSNINYHNYQPSHSLNSTRAQLSVIVETGIKSVMNVRNHEKIESKRDGPDNQDQIEIAGLLVSDFCIIFLIKL